MYKTNIQRQKGTRKRPQVGDIFRMFIPSKGWLFGRVVRTDACGDGWMPPQHVPDQILIYIYDVVSPHSSPIPDLDKDKLLIPPRITNMFLWNEGHLVTLDH